MGIGKTMVSANSVDMIPIECFTHNDITLTSFPCTSCEKIWSCQFSLTVTEPSIKREFDT